MKVTRRRIRLFPPVEVPSSSREEDRRDLPDREPGDDGSLVAGGDGPLADPIPFGEGLRDGFATGMVDAGRVCKMERVETEGGAQ